MPRQRLSRSRATRFLLPGLVLVAVGIFTMFGLVAQGAGASSKNPKSGTSGYASTGGYASTASGPAGTASATSATPTTAVPRTGKHVVLTSGGTVFVNNKPKVTPTAPPCLQAAQRIGYKGPKNNGSPQNSPHITCVNGHVVSYGDPSTIIYKLPPAADIANGHKLFEENCSSCHLPTAQGSAAAPSLHGVGPATVDFWVTTGRMPAATPLQIQEQQKPPRLTKKEADDVAVWINSLTPSAPYIPTVNVKQADLNSGASLFALNCAACHTITGAGDALAYGTFSPSLHTATARQVAEAIRTGPGNMPRFTGNLDDSQVRDVVAYVTEKIQHPANKGGFGLGGVGPVTEGFVALLFGVGGMMLVAFWIGDRA